MSSNATDSNAVTFRLPWAPHGKERPRFDPNTGRVYTPTTQKQYEAMVGQLARIAMRGRQPMQGPVGAAMDVSIVPPPSWPAERRAAALRGEFLPTCTPDLDNACKSILDGCNSVVYGDDRQIVGLLTVRRYGPANETTCVFRPVQRVTVDVVGFEWLRTPAAQPEDAP